MSIAKRGSVGVWRVAFSNGVGELEYFDFKKCKAEEYAVTIESQE